MTRYYNAGTVVLKEEDGLNRLGTGCIQSCMEAAHACKEKENGEQGIILIEARWTRETERCDK